MVAGLGSSGLPLASSRPARRVPWGWTLGSPVSSLHTARYSPAPATTRASVSDRAGALTTIGGSSSGLPVADRRETPPLTAPRQVLTLQASIDGAATAGRDATLVAGSI